MGLKFLRFSSICVEGMRRDHAPSVGKGPGGIALRRMWCFPHSTAKEVVSARTPALAHADGTTNPDPQFAAAYVVTILSTLPGCFFSIQRLPKTCVQLKLPLRTMPTTALNALGVSFS